MSSQPGHCVQDSAYLGLETALGTNKLHHRGARMVCSMGLHAVGSSCTTHMAPGLGECASHLHTTDSK